MTHTTALQPAHIAELYRLYRAQTDDLPHCLTPSEGRFAADLGRPEAGRIIVAELDGRARGFAALRAVTDDEDREADAITALFFEDLADGAALVRACAAHARSGALLAFPQAHGNGPVQSYNAGWDGLSAGLALQARVLTEHGFEAYYRELLLARDFAGQEAPAEELEGVTFEAGASDAGGYRQRAWIGDDRVGLCIYSTAAHASDDPRAAQIGSIDWLWTDESVRRRGIARSLMLRALAHLQSLGCTACWLSTGAENAPAQALYVGLGFAIVDSTTSFIRAPA
jgi:ribosomal protein S18 acetylase RimI-like enzyme